MMHSRWLIVFILILCSIHQVEAQGISLATSFWKNKKNQCSKISFAEDYMINGEVYAIEMVGDIAYIGGDFTSVLGQTRNHIAAIDTSTDLLLPFDPNVSGRVHALKYDMGLLFAGGRFDTVNGRSVSYGFSTSDLSGQPYLNNPSIDGQVIVSIPDGAGGWYIGGDFNSVAGQPRYKLARINADGTLNSFNADVYAWKKGLSSRVFALLLDGTTLYVGGEFNEIGGQPRANLASIDTVTSTVTNWTANTTGQVHTLAKINNTLYIGGLFQAAQAVASSGAAVDMSTSQVLVQNALVSGGAVTASISDGAGGWYIAGSFTSVGGLPRQGIARIHSDGSVHSFSSSVTGSVYTMILDGTTLYLGGGFSNIAGSARNNIGAIDLLTGLATSWNPGSNGFVNTMEMYGSTIYVGGSFSNIGSQNRSYLAGVDKSTGLATAWNPVLNSAVSALAVVGSNIYVGGGFTQINNLGFNHIAVFDISTIQNNASLTWNPGSNGAVRDIKAIGSTLYIGGDFTLIGGQFRNYLAAITTSSDIATSWNPSPNANVYKLAPLGTNLIVVGGFNNIGGQTRKYLAEIDTTTSNATAFSIPFETVSGPSRSAISASGSSIYLGGEFNAIGGDGRNYIAAFDMTLNTNNLTAWNPDSDGYVFSLAPLGSNKIFAGGNFLNIGGLKRKRIALLTTLSNNAMTWDPGADNTVTNLVFDGVSTLYVGGVFHNIGYSARNYIAALDYSSDNALPWDPNADGYISSMFLNGTTLYVGGHFSNIGGKPRSYVAALDTTLDMNNAKDWQSTVNSDVGTISGQGSDLYLGGNFDQAGGVSRSNLAAFDTTKDINNVTPWKSDTVGDVYSFEMAGTTLYVGGAFNYVEGEGRSQLAAIDTTKDDHNVTSWNPNSYDSGSIFTMLLSGNRLYIGGNFAAIGDSHSPLVRHGLAALDTTLNDPSSVTLWDPVIEGTIFAMALKDNILYLGGHFDSVSAQPRKALAAVDTTIDTNNVTSWQPDPVITSGKILSLKINKNNIYAGGAFTNDDPGLKSDLLRNNLASFKMNTDANNINSWNPKPDFNNYIRALGIYGKKLLAGGYIEKMNTGQPDEVLQSHLSQMCIPP